ncbi:MAG: DUF4331 domain-containing protein [Planctomycetes bacterium]|nr:DUF4331 domain-containing protein [Planctomycetota bacterium]
MKNPILSLAALVASSTSLLASSHMDAPLITLDDAANLTDVYAFVSPAPGSTKYLTLAASVYPFEDPGIGPNKFNFDDRVAYAIHVSTGADLATGKKSYSYAFLFKTNYKSKQTILQSYTGVVQNVDDAAQNLTQTYDVLEVDWHPGGRGIRIIGSGIVPPNNQGRATPRYNQASGDGPALDGVAQASQLDAYTAQTITTFADGYRTWAGQRDDGFYADIGATFDLLSLRNPGKDSQKGFNVHTMVIQVPVNLLGGDMQVVGVHASTYRDSIELRTDSMDPVGFGGIVQVGRQGNPLFNEAFVAIQDKDKYNRLTPETDAQLFAQYALNPELAALLNALVFTANPIPGITSNRTDLAGIFIPDVIKCDLSTPPARLAGGGPNHPTNPDDAGFSRLSIFGGDTLSSALTGAQVPGGWPNGRRFGDDVYDIGVSAVISDLRVSPPVIRIAGDNVDANDVAYNKVMPYAPTPQNGRAHAHD